MRNIYLVLINLLIVNACAIAQLQVDATNTPTYLVENMLVGGGVTVSGVIYRGSNLAIGSFDGAASNIGLSSGLILSTGMINNSIGPNNDSAKSTQLGYAGDLDLSTISHNSITPDAAILEFDFVASSDTVKFNYVFASEEYTEYVNAGFNDMFGFFLSGPGISGPYSNNAINIALIPGTSTSVTIDSLNNSVNAAYYIDNGNGKATSTTPNGTTVQYDGFTVPLTAIAAPLQCGQRYHIKIAIADCNDSNVDSGVFLEKISFSVPKAAILSSATSFGGSPTSNHTTFKEGGGEATIKIDRGLYNLDVADTIMCTISGTSTNGVDYTLNGGDSVFFAAGQQIVYITMDALNDSLIEGNETITLTTYIENFCKTDTSEITVYIIDSTILSSSADISENFLSTILDIYPNPTQKGFNISIKNGSMNQIIDLLDIQGRVISSKKLEGTDKLFFDMESFENGMYFIRIYSNGNSIYNKVIKN